MAEPSGLTKREEEALRRRLDRHIKWREVAMEMARDMFSDDVLDRMVAEGWWRQQLDMPRVVHSLAELRAMAGPGTNPTPLGKEE